MWIHQDAWIHLGDFEEVTSVDYMLKKKGNGVYIFVMEGIFKVANEKLEKRDALGVWNTESITLCLSGFQKQLLFRAYCS
jgi:hypothetical protein